jgi:hypothetical protein
MLAAREYLGEKDPRVVSDTALEIFFKITKSWGLKAQEERILLGDPASSTFYKWRNGEGPVISKDTLERISYVMGVYKSLRLLFSTEDQANAWPKKENRDFDGETAIGVMLKGSVANLMHVRRYLDGMRG